MKRLILASAVVLLANCALSAVIVKTEQLDSSAQPGGFKTIPGPSRSDIATSASVSIVGNQIEGGGADIGALVDGRLPTDPNDLKNIVFMRNDNANGGSFLMDLGKVQPVAAVTSYSWHEFAPDQGARGPQVYTLYGSASENSDPANLAAWTKLADVDTRPNKTGEKWGGQHGVCITDSAGKLGDFRYLLFAVQPTRSPKQRNAVWTNTLFTEIDVHTQATLAKAGDAVVAKRVKVQDVWVVFKTHFDLGFTDLAENVFAKYRGPMMDGALKVIEQNRNLPPEQRFVWTVAGWPLQAQILGPKQDPARRERIVQAIKEGSLAVHALPFTMHTESLDLEDLVRGLHYSAQLARDYGRPLPISGKMTDVPQHCWVLPTLLANAGVKFMQIGCNPASQYPRFPQLFWWEGPDGSRVLCNYTAFYGSGIIPPRGWPSRNYLAMIMTGDNHGPPNPGEVESLRKQAERELPGVQIHFGTLDDFARAVEAEKPDLPIVRGDTPDTWIHGLMSLPEATKIARDVRPLEPALDSLDTHLKAWGLTTTPLAAALAEAYENSLLYGEHTWGMNAEYGPRRLYGEAWKKWLAEAAAEPAPADGDYSKLPNGSKKKWLKSYDDHYAYIRKTEAIVDRELRARLDQLAQAVKGDGQRIVVWNGLPWPRSGRVEMPGQPGRFLFAENVPANGYKTYSADQLDQTDRTDSGTTLDTPFFKVVFDLQRGGIASLVEKKTGRELADKTSPYALGQFLHERFSTHEVFDRFFRNYSRIQDGWGLNDIGKPGMPSADQSPYLAVSPSAWTLSVQRDTSADIATLTAGDAKGLAKAYTLKFTFPRQVPLVDCEWTVTDKTPEKIPEGGWLCFPFAITKPEFTVGRPGGPINPATDIVPGANRHLYAVASGVTIAGEDKSGVSLCPMDSPLVSLDKPGLWWWTMDFVPKTPTVFVNLYNNMWNTNFRLWQEGSWSERVRFWPTTELAVPSWEARLPLLAAVASGSAGNLPTTQAGLSLSRAGVLVTAFGGDPDGNPGTLLRVWDQSGVAGALTVTLPEGIKAKRAQPVNLRGEKTGTPLPIKRSQFAFDLGAYAPASFVLM